MQFVDGDCEVVGGLARDRPVACSTSNPTSAVVCGRRRERYPEQTIYNRLADLEWDSPVGEAKACGGDALMRAPRRSRQVGGYNPAIIAGEEPEYACGCGKAGWTILRIDAEMTLHDMAMTRFGQWWKRTVRAGHAYAEGARCTATAGAAFRPRDAEHLLLGARCPAPGLRPGLAHLGDQPAPAVPGLSLLFLKTIAIIRRIEGPAKDARLFAGLRPRRQVPAGRRRN